MDVIAAIFWFPITLTVVWTAWIIARRVFPDDNPLQWMMHALVVVWSWIAISSFTMGTIGILNAISLATVTLILALVTFIVVFQRLSHSFQIEVAIAKPSHQGWVDEMWFVLWALVAGLYVALVFFQGICVFPTDWDTLAYHRPLIDHWIQTGSLYVPACWVWQVPASNELMGLWWAVAFSGDFWVPLMNLPAALLLAMGMFEIGNLMALSSFVRNSVVIASLASTIIFSQVVDASNDIAVVSLFITAVAYKFRFLKEGMRRRDLVMAGICLGLLVGIKYYALGYAAAFLLGFLMILSPKVGWHKAVSFAGILAALALAMGGWWYARNIVVTGTPIYPLGYIGANTASAKLPETFWRTSIIGNGQIEVLPQFVERVWKTAGLCQTISVLALPLSLSHLVISSQLLRDWIPANTAVLRSALGMLLVGALLNYGITPNTIDPNDSSRLDYAYIVVRFSQVPLLLSLLAFSVMIYDFAWWIGGTNRNGILRSLIASIITTSFAAVAILSFCWVAVKSNAKQEVALLPLAAFDVGVILLIARVFFRNVLKTWPCRLGLAIGSTVVFVLSTSLLSTWWHKDFVDFYDSRFGTSAVSIVSDWKSGVPSIASTHLRYYPFFGSRRHLHAFTPRRIASKRLLALYLETHSIDFLVVAHDRVLRLNRNPDISAWVNQQPEIFEQIDEGPLFRTYRVKKDRVKDELIIPSSGDTPALLDQ